MQLVSYPGFITVLCVNKKMVVRHTVDCVSDFIVQYDIQKGRLG